MRMIMMKMMVRMIMLINTLVVIVMMMIMRTMTTMINLTLDAIYHVTFFTDKKGATSGVVYVSLWGSMGVSGERRVGSGVFHRDRSV